MGGARSSFSDQVGMFWFCPSVLNKAMELIDVVLLKTCYEENSYPTLCGLNEHTVCINEKIEAHMCMYTKLNGDFSRIKNNKIAKRNFIFFIVCNSGTTVY